MLVESLMDSKSKDQVQIPALLFLLASHFCSLNINLLIFKMFCYLPSEFFLLYKLSLSAFWVFCFCFCFCLLYKLLINKVKKPSVWDVRRLYAGSRQLKLFPHPSPNPSPMQISSAPLMFVFQNPSSHPGLDLPQFSLYPSIKSQFS